MNWRPCEVVRLLSGFLGWHLQREPEQLDGKANLDHSEFAYKFLPSIQTFPGIHKMFSDHLVSQFVKTLFLSYFI